MKCIFVLLSVLIFASVYGSSEPNDTKRPCREFKFMKNAVGMGIIGGVSGAFLGGVICSSPASAGNSERNEVAVWRGRRLKEKVVVQDKVMVQDLVNPAEFRRGLKGGVYGALLGFGYQYVQELGKHTGYDTWDLLRESSVGFGFCGSVVGAMVDLSLKNRSQSHFTVMGFKTGCAVGVVNAMYEMYKIQQERDNVRS